MRTRKLTGNLRPSLAASSPGMRGHMGVKSPSYIQVSGDGYMSAEDSRETSKWLPDPAITRFIKNHSAWDQSSPFVVSSTRTWSSWFIWWSNTSALRTCIGAEVRGWEAAKLAGRHRRSVRTEVYVGTAWQKPEFHQWLHGAEKEPPAK